MVEEDKMAMMKERQMVVQVALTWEVQVAGVEEEVGDEHHDCCCHTCLHKEVG